jgi:putative membrane protein
VETGAVSDPQAPLDDPGTNLASNRTAMSFERTRMASERTLMAVMRTALSLIGFGFTIYQFLSKFAPDHPHAAQSARNFGISLIFLGIGTLVVGLFSQFRSLSLLRGRRNSLNALGLLRSAEAFRPSPISVIAVLLLVIGLVAILGIALRAGPFE